MAVLDKEFYFLDEAAQITGRDADVLRIMCNRGDEIQGIKRPMKEGGRRLVWTLSPEAIQYLMGDNSDRRYDALINQWGADMRSGFHSDKGLMIEDVTITSYKGGLVNFWKLLEAPSDYMTEVRAHIEEQSKKKGQHIPFKKVMAQLPEARPEVKHLTPENLRLVLSKIPYEKDIQKCHYATRRAIYDGMCSFFRFLIRKGMKSEMDLLQLRKLKPRRKYDALQRSLSEVDLQSLIDFNEHHLHGRTEYDVQFNKTFLLLASCAGLRRKEIAGLKLYDLFFDIPAPYLRAFGKGSKIRYVGMKPEVIQQLQHWIHNMRPRSAHDQLLLTRDGTPAGMGLLNKRLLRLAKSAGYDIDLHGLRRTFATIEARHGTPPELLRLTLGHSSLEITQLYVKTNEMEAVASIGARSNLQQPTPEAGKPAHRPTTRPKLYT
jgi:integrase